MLTSVEYKNVYIIYEFISTRFILFDTAIVNYNIILSKVLTIKKMLIKLLNYY